MNSKLEGQTLELDRPRVVAEPVEAPQPETPKVIAPKPPLIPTPPAVTSRKPLRVEFHVGKDFVRRFDIPSPDKRRAATKVIHVYPTLAEWAGRTMPDNVNPRSHDPQCLRSPVARDIERTLLDQPEDFFLANRGSTIIAEAVNFNDKTGNMELLINDPENQGLADGATTDAVIAKVQTALAREVLERKDASFTELLSLDNRSKIPEALRDARIHLEIFVGMDDRARLANLVQGRNTSRQVKGWSMADFKGQFEWIKEIIEAEDSQFRGKVGYEENAGRDISVLNVLALLTLFHPEFDEKDSTGAAKAPVVAYVSGGRMDARLSDEELLKGYKSLAPVLLDILKLHDHVALNFGVVYEKAFGKKSKLSRRQGVKSYLVGEEKYELPLTGAKADYELPNGYVFPILAAMRALLSKRGTGKVHWRMSPFEFFDKRGKVLVSELMDQVEAAGGVPNEVGKRKLAYTALHASAKVELAEELEKR